MRVRVGYSTLRVLVAALILTSVAAATPDPSSVPPPVGRIARELAGGGAERVIVFASAEGKSYVATAGTRRPKPDQRFRVGSVTKTFTATIVLQLVDEGKLSLSSRLEDHVPGVVPRGDEMTIHQLLQHRSGLVNYTDYVSWLKGTSHSASTADGSGQQRLAAGSAPAWSPDGRRIVFVRGRGNKAEIYVMNADGSGQRNLTRNAVPDGDPAWSPDGRMIAFPNWVPWAGVGGNFELFVMNADGSGQRRLTSTAFRESAPAWSPGGRTIVFETLAVFGGPGGQGFAYGVNVVNANGSGDVRPLSRAEEPRRAQAARAPRPAWSPDGRMIAYLSSRDGNYDVYVMNADGSGQTNVTRSRANEGWLAWSPRRTK